MTKNEHPPLRGRRNPPLSPRLPNSDSQPPYAPGGVPEPEGSGLPPDNSGDDRTPPSTLPPKLDP